jgi:uncharacterized repeat protein (TIGR03806 family)
VIALVLACGCDRDPVESDTDAVSCADDWSCEELSEYRFDDRAWAFDVAAALWSDNAAKERAIVLPEGGTITFDEAEAWRWPVGTTLIKTFHFPTDLREPDGPTRLVETRLLANTTDGWTAHVYLWDDAQSEATRLVPGTIVQVEYVDLEGVAQVRDYIVPNTNQCQGCHVNADVVRPLGPFTHQLNHDGQIDALEALGAFDADVPPADTLGAFEDPFGTGPLDDRARAYLHANCAHCHRDGGAAMNSGLWLDAWQTDPYRMGVCKTPTAAGAGTGGFQYDIVPGRPEESVLVFRMSSTEPEIKMPELPNLLPDPRGIALITAWIDAMTPEGCGS